MKQDLTGILKTQADSKAMILRLKNEIKAMDAYTAELSKKLAAQGFEIVYAAATRSPKASEQVVASMEVDARATGSPVEVDIDKVNIDGGQNRSQANMLSDDTSNIIGGEGTTPVLSNVDVLASSAGDADEYTKMLIRQELDTRMVEVEEKIETMMNNNADLNKSVV